MLLAQQFFQTFNNLCSQGHMRGVEEKKYYIMRFVVVSLEDKTGKSSYLFPLPPFRSSSPDLFLSIVNYWETLVLAQSKYFLKFLISLFSFCPTFSHTQPWSHHHEFICTLNLNSRCLYRIRKALHWPTIDARVLCLHSGTHHLPLSHLESCCSVLIGWWCPRVRKIAKSRPIKSAAVPEYNSPSVLWQNKTTYTYFNSIEARETKHTKYRFHVKTTLMLSASLCKATYVYPVSLLKGVSHYSFSTNSEKLSKVWFSAHY